MSSENNIQRFSLFKGYGYVAVLLGTIVLITGTILILYPFDTNRRVTDNDSEQQPLAQIGNLAVSKDHFVSAFKRFYYKTGQTLKPSFRNKKAVLKEEFDPYVLATYARSRGWHEDRAAQHRLGMIRRKVYAEEYRERYVTDTVTVTESEVRNYFVKHNTVLHASHLYAPNRREIDSLYTLLKQGASFKELAKDVFKNDYLAQNGGDLGKIRVNEMDPSFERVAFNLEVGEISKPVRTSQGYSIVKVTARYTKPIITRSDYISKKDELRQIVRRRQNQMAIRRHLRSTAASLQINPQALQDIWNDVRRQRLEFLSSYQEQPLLNINIGPWKNRDLSANSDFQFSGRMFLREAYYTPVQARNRIRTYSAFREFVNGLAFRTYIIKKFRNRGKTEKTLVQSSIRQTFNDYLNNRVLDTLKANLQYTKQELRDEYRQHRSQYAQPLQLNLSRIVVSSKEEANTVVQKLQKGQPFTQVLQKHTIKGQDLMTDGKLGYKNIGSFGARAPKLRNISKGQVKGPFKRSPNRYIVYKCNGRIAPRHLPFHKVKDKVRKHLVYKHLEQKQQKIIQKTMRVHNGDMNLDALRKLKIKL